MKVAIYMLFQEKEIADTLQSIKKLSLQLNSDRLLFLLGNAISDSQISDIRQKVLQVTPYAHIYNSEKNLGVAGGRNFLINKARTDFNPDVFISLDNDIIIPEDYISKVISIFSASDTRNKIGIIAPVLSQGTFLNTPNLKDFNYPDKDELIHQIKHEYFVKDNLNTFYHCGVTNWKKHYLRNPASFYISNFLLNFFINPFIYRLFYIKFKAHQTRTFKGRDDRFILNLFYNNKDLLEVDSLPGGIQCFNKELIEDIGIFDNKFNPFGFEDADFCIRAIKSGYTNYLISNTILIHDVGERFISRPYKSKITHFARCKKILIKKHTNLSQRYLYYLSYFIFYPLVILRDTKDKKDQNSLSIIFQFWRSFIA